MMNFSRWQVTLILLVCLAGIVFSAPNLVSKADLAKLPGFLPSRQVHLGLDLQGGSYLLLEADLESVLREKTEAASEAVRTALRQASIPANSVDASGRSILIKLRDPAQTQDAMRALRTMIQSGTSLDVGTQSDMDLSSQSDGSITLAYTEVGLRDKAAQVISQSIEIIRRRIDSTGVNEPLIQRQGSNRILVQLPGVEDPDRVKRLLNTTARMTFRLVDVGANLEASRPPPGTEFLPGDSRQTRYAVRKRVEVEGANLSNARAGTNPQTGEWVVNFEFDSVGTRRFAAVTQANVNKPFAIVLDDKVLSAPVIREPITGGRGQISGSFTAQSATELSVLLRAGALPAPLKIVEERTVGPELGADSIKAGVYSVLVGLALVCAYMVAAYGLFGFFAVVALFVNLILTIAVLSILEATLTLPGIAGLLLSVGMSVDANVLINERVREETKKGRTPIAALQAGFSRAFSTIVDANVTTLLKMFLLFILGSGPIQGFAVTISLGILMSMFTATVLVRLMIVTWLKQRRPKLLPV